MYDRVACDSGRTAAHQFDRTVTVALDQVSSDGVRVRIDRVYRSAGAGGHRNVIVLDQGMTAGRQYDEFVERTVDGAFAYRDVVTQRVSGYIVFCDRRGTVSLPGGGIAEHAVGYGHVVGWLEVYRGH